VAVSSKSLPRIGQLGVGRMGEPILTALEAAGFDVLAFDPVTRPDSSESAVIEHAEILVTVLPGAFELPVVRDTLVLDLTSNDPRNAERAVAQGVAIVGAPMGGGVAAASSGSLRFFVGGAHDHVARARPVLDLLGTIDHVGEGVGDGYVAKLLANLLWFGQAVAVSEALLLGQALGVAPSSLAASLTTSAGGSAFIDDHLPALLAGDYLETFGIDRVVEELEILESLAAENRIPFELSTLVTRLHREALDRFGPVDGELLAAKLLEERAGRNLRS
jgi:3-hydroxyisobutyrate dehydrogenase